MDTKFAEFGKNKQLYRSIRNFIIDFADEETNLDSFSHFFKDDYYYDKIEHLLQSVNNKFEITLDEFFNIYRDKIYADKNFIRCCGLVDVLLYQYDKKYPLGGDIGKPDAESKYTYGYQKNSLGVIYIKQKFGSLEKFYEEVVESIKTQYITTSVYVEVISVEDCTLMFTHLSNVKKLTYDYVHLIVDDIYVIFIGGDDDVYNLVKAFEQGTQQEFIDFDEIKKDIDFHQTTNKYNL